MATGPNAIAIAKPDAAVSIAERRRAGLVLKTLFLFTLFLPDERSQFFGGLMILRLASIENVHNTPK
jgi:hypothetical protein